MQRETLVLLPGMMCDHHLFAPQIEHFGDRYNVIVPKIPDLPDIGAMASTILQSLPEGAFNLAGLSMGGILALAISDLAPQRVLRLGLFDSNCYADAPERYDVRNRQIDDVKAGLLREVIIDEMKPLYLASKNRGDQELLDLLIGMAMETGKGAFIAQSLALRDRPSLCKVLKGFAKPLLVLCGAEDHLCSPTLHQDMAQLAQKAQLTIVPDAGHISTLENSDAVNQAMHRWLQCHH